MESNTPTSRDDEPSSSSKSPKRFGMPGFKFESLADSPIKEDDDDEEDTEPVEECSVCRNEIMDTCTLSDCTHEFCYDCIIGWLTKGSGPFCPMCKAPVSFIKRKGADQEISVQQIKAEQEPEATTSEDLLTEKRIVTRKIRGCRRIMNKIDEVIGSSSRNLEGQRREARAAELRKMKQLCVSQLNSLQMLRDDIEHGAAKGLIVSKGEFRRLVYERQVIVEGLPQHHRSITKQEFLTNIEHYRTVLNTFLSVELKSLPAKVQPKVDKENMWYFYTLHDAAPDDNDEFVHRIFSMISDQGIDNLNSKDINEALNGLVTCRNIMTFIGEIKSLINSRMTFLEWCGSVTYRNRLDRGGRENVGTEVVTVDDTVDDDEVEPVRNDRHSHSNYNLRNRQFPVFTPFDKIFNPSNGFQRQAMNNRHPSSSDTDQDDDIYFQAPLRLGPTGVNPFRPMAHTSFPPIPPAGLYWSDLTNPSSKLTRPPRSPTSGTSSKPIPVVSLDDDDGDESSRHSNSSADEDIQVVDESDGTIVLDESLRTPSIQAPTKSGLGKRKSDLSHQDLDQWKRIKVEPLPHGLVQDVQSLITKYRIPTDRAASMIQSATEQAIISIPAPEPVDLLSSTKNTNEPSNSATSPNLQPDEALQLAGYLARNGLGSWSKNAPTKPTSPYNH
ncbi:hypothetical protein GCK72_006235 [Caenorhabditis remanei]|uniref:RING-type domain-containing protein n=1 Tax=Caenorhabditis remanei TaxID=31234 RepID=A0A6A5HG72_CAERE|nr:hypothetical protein GCK72_006235 [Caenorhabditis remanei]KAF1766279.1 hypothetical protein GCK72_006235 [Caenorhabditis remanei]